MRYKHKFFIVYEDRNGEMAELATCGDENTANFLSEHFRNTYENKLNGVSVVYRHGKTEKTIVYASYNN